MYWIDKTLAQRPAKSHAFVFAHKNILGRNHKDSMFGGTITGADPGDGNGVDISSLSDDDKYALEAKIFAENEFIACMQDNGVPLVISVITSYSIHYTKLYDSWTAAKNTSAVRIIFLQVIISP